jgi:hypothetical protein
VLTRAVCAALDRGSAAIERYQVQSLSASSGAATAGVYRVSGTANDRDIRRDWALVLKIIRPAAAAWNPAAREIDHPIYWKREALAYQSGMLDDLPGGIAAPRCLAIEERADESCWLWLEQVEDSYGSRWPLAQYAQAARALGRFNGAYLAGRALPAYPWLGPPGALRGTLQAFALVRDVVESNNLAGPAAPRCVPRAGRGQAAPLGAVRFTAGELPHNVVVKLQVVSNGIPSIVPITCTMYSVAFWSGIVGISA